MQRPGDQIGAYELVSLLGHGGFGSVWSARRVESTYEVALKVLHRDHVRERASPEYGPSTVDRFLAEARIIQRLSHPGLVFIHDVIDDRRQEVVAYAMEKLTGCDLTRVGEMLDLETLLDVIAETAETLAFVHRAGVIHRDVKPQNIFICDPTPEAPKCKVKLLDFGTAKELYATGRLGPTATNVLIGTLGAMAPESFRPKNEPTPAIDQWGLGVTLFHLLAGRPPFMDGSIVALVRKVELDPVPKLVLLERFGDCGVTEELEMIIGRCLAKKPDERHSSMDDVSFALREVLAKMRTAELESATVRDPAYSATMPMIKLAQVMMQKSSSERDTDPDPVEDAKEEATVTPPADAAVDGAVAAALETAVDGAKTLEDLVEATIPAPVASTLPTPIAIPAASTEPARALPAVRAVSAPTPLAHRRIDEAQPRASSFGWPAILLIAMLIATAVIVALLLIPPA